MYPFIPYHTAVPVAGKAAVTGAGCQCSARELDLKQRYLKLYFCGILCDYDERISDLCSAVNHQVSGKKLQSKVVVLILKRFLKAGVWKGEIVGISFQSPVTFFLVLKNNFRDLEYWPFSFFFF